MEGSDYSSLRQVRVLKYLKESCIVFPLEASSKEEVIRMLAQRASSCLDNVSEEEVFKAILEREELGTTGIGGGIAIPHAKVKDIERLAVVTGISRKGVPFDAIDGEPVHIIFMLLAPEEATTSYLRMLAKTSRLLKDKKMIVDLMNAWDPSQALKIIDQAENRSYGALI